MELMNRAANMDASRTVSRIHFKKKGRQNRKELFVAIGWTAFKQKVAVTEEKEALLKSFLLLFLGMIGFCSSTSLLRVR